MPPAGAVTRRELLKDLASVDSALTAIVAPPGYGKTTTAVQLVGTLDRPVAWVSLEAADSNPARFWTYVAAAFASAGVAGADATYADLADGGVDAAMLTLRSAVEATDRRLVLVLDDLHVIDSIAVEEQLNDWLRHPIDNLRMVCTSRSDLPLPVGRLRSQGLLTEARIDKLAFTEQEAAALLSGAFGLGDLTPAQLHALESRTEGWPVGLFLAGLTLRDDPDIEGQLERFAGDTRHLTEYMAREAMDGVSTDVRAFVLSTSIVSVLDPDLCDALTGQIGSLKILRGLVADNVFTSALDHAATVFHYHPLFREHLQSALAADHPELVAELHGRASAWYEVNGEMGEAITHATAAGDLARAQQLITSTSLQFSNAGHFDTVIDWVAGLGDPARLGVEVALLMSWTMLNLRRYDELEEWMTRAEAAATTPSHERILALQLPTIRAHRARHEGNVGAMVHCAEMALANEDDYPSGDEAEALELWLRVDAGRGAAFSSLGAALFWAGDLDRGHDHVATGLTVARQTNMLLEVIFAYGYLALIEASRGDAETAISHADQALALVGPGQERHLQPSHAYLARAIANLSIGRPADAQNDLDRARELGRVRGEPLQEALLELQQARVWHRTGDNERARAAVRAARSVLDGLPDPRFDTKLKAVEAEIRFVAKDVDDLPAGARELTGREQAVLELLPHGLPRKELAQQLHVSENTIKTHLTSIRHKLGLSGRESIVDRAAELGLLESARP